MSFLDTYNPADAWDVYCSREEERDRLAREDATCEKCANCNIANSSRAEAHTRNILWHLDLWQPKDSVQRPVETLLEEIAMCCDSARKDFAWCSYHNEFIDADDDVEDCGGFEC